MSAAARAQVNAGEQKPEPSLPFTLTQVATFKLPWRIAFLPDGRMLDHRKNRPGVAGHAAGREDAGCERAGGPVAGQGGMLGVFLSPNYATDHNVYLTYSEPGEASGDIRPRARAWRKLTDRTGTASLDGLQVIWRDMPKGRGGQVGAEIAFSPDGQYLFLTVGDRQRMTPAQDPNTALGKILRLTLDGKPAPGQSAGRQDRRRERAAHQSAAQHRSGEDRAGHQHVHVPRTEPDAVGDLDLAVIARRTVWRSRPTAGCGKSSTARAAATS